jgi:hypothetical protein
VARSGVARRGLGDGARRERAGERRDVERGDALGAHLVRRRHAVDGEDAPGAVDAQAHGVTEVDDLRRVGADEARGQRAACGRPGPQTTTAPFWRPAVRRERRASSHMANEFWDRRDGAGRRVDLEVGRAVGELHVGEGGVAAEGDRGAEGGVRDGAAVGAPRAQLGARRAAGGVERHHVVRHARRGAGAVEDVALDAVAGAREALDGHGVGAEAHDEGARVGGGARRGALRGALRAEGVRGGADGDGEQGGERAGGSGGRMRRTECGRGGASTAQGRSTRASSSGDGGTSSPPGRTRRGRASGCRRPTDRPVEDAAAERGQGGLLLGRGGRGELARTVPRRSR